MISSLELFYNKLDLNPKSHEVLQVSILGKKVITAPRLTGSRQQQLVLELCWLRKTYKLRHILAAAGDQLKIWQCIAASLFEP
jgi:hypothetical protein